MKVSGNVSCIECKAEFSKYAFNNHFKYNHLGLEKKWSGKSWNKGLTKEIDVRLKDAGRKYSERHRGKKRKPLSDLHKESVSKSMKIAHKERRAWNIGKSRWNGKKSYPEVFFTEVILNGFEDKNFEYEFPVEIYSIDFAWPHKSKGIEINGDQHYRFDEYIERDKRKLECLERNGWSVLVIDWKNMFKDTKTWIKIAKEFIDVAG